MTSLNTYVNPLTLDSSTSPTVVNFSDFPSSLTVGHEYNFEVTATDPSDTSISAFYSITVTIVEPCTIATFLSDTVQDAVSPEWVAFPYYDENGTYYYTKFR